MGPYKQNLVPYLVRRKTKTFCSSTFMRRTSILVLWRIWLELKLVHFLKTVLKEPYMAKIQTFLDEQAVYSFLSVAKLFNVQSIFSGNPGKKFDNGFMVAMAVDVETFSMFWWNRILMLVIKRLLRLKTAYGRPLKHRWCYHVLKENVRKVSFASETRSALVPEKCKSKQLHTATSIEKGIFASIWYETYWKCDFCISPESLY